MAATLTDPLIGHLVDGRYEVLSRIARGGMATVYLAKDRRLDREVALKVMHAHLAEGTTGAEFVARFRREARSAARLTHPGLVGVFDQGVDGETSYLTMEYIDGTNLRRHLGEQGALTVATALETAAAVLDALAAAHRVGLVHRDVKPENVLLASDGRIKVADFGLARAVTEVTSTTTGTILGTVAYLAPELVAHGISDTRTDVYAVGILLYEMLTGSQPFTGATPIQVAYQHVHNDVPSPSDAVAWLPAEIDELVGALAARDPDERPVDARTALDLVHRTTAALDPATLARRADVAPSITLPAATADGDTTTGEVGEGDDVDEPSAETPRTVGPPPPPPPAPDEPHDPDATEAIHVPWRSRGADGSAGQGADGRDDDMSRTVALRIGSGLDEDAETTAAAPPHRRRWRLIALIAVLVAALVGGGWWFMTSGPGAFTTVPTGLVGAEAAAAEAALTAAGLDFTETDPVFDPTIPDGSVVTTEPAPGERVRKDGSVAVSVSKGPDLRVVPSDLPGKPVDDATALLTQAGFVVPDPTHVYDDVVAAGIVIGISVEQGASLPVGTEVVLTVSDGPEPLTIISVTGATAEVAKTQLEAQGLRVAEAQDYSETVPAGSVISQDPAAGTPGHRTDTVTIVVSQGPPLVPVPNVVTMGVSAAKDALEAAGFVVDVNRTWPWDNVIVEQKPAANEPLQKGSTVTIYAG